MLSPARGSIAAWLEFEMVARAAVDDGLVYWMLFGSVVGFLYAWRHLSKRSARLRHALSSAHSRPKGWDLTLAHNRSLWFAAGLLAASAGAIGGGAIWMAFSSLVSALD